MEKVALAATDTVVSLTLDSRFSGCDLHIASPSGIGLTETKRVKLIIGFNADVVFVVVVYLPLLLWLKGHDKAPPLRPRLVLESRPLVENTLKEGVSQSG